jgi:hypothetical protein
MEPFQCLAKEILNRQLNFDLRNNHLIPVKQESTIKLDKVVVKKPQPAVANCCEH